MAKLLFVNTFCHDTVEDFNIDFVKFSSGAMATVREVRIIPGGARIPVAEAPQRQGITAPNSFNLEVFAKNSKRPDASVFERIALFEYHFDSDIRFQVPAYTTDGILFKGNYTALSVAIYGDPVSGDTSGDLIQTAMTSTIPTLGGITPSSALSSPSSLQPPSSAIAFVPSPSDSAPGLLATAANVVFPVQSPQILAVGAPIPTWVGPPAAVPTVLHLAPPPPTFNPLVPPPISVIPPFPPGAPNAGTPGTVVDYRISPHTTAGVVVHVPFDPTRPPPSFHTPQHSPQLVPPQISPSAEKRGHQVHTPTRRSNEPASKIKRYDSGETIRIHHLEGKPIETVSTVKPVMSSVSSANIHSMRSRAILTSDDIQLEEGEYAGSEGDNSEKFDLENISEEEFEFDDTMAAQVNDTELQEDLLANVRFNPYKFTIAPLKYFKDPSLSQYQIEYLNYKRQACGGMES